MNALTKTAKKIFNAMAFANSGNLNEFKTLLKKIEPQSEKLDELAVSKSISVVCRVPLNLPIGHAQQAL